MEIQLQELIDRIKREGVEAAESEAQAILQAAGDEARRIVEDAKAQAEKILADARRENERTVSAGEEALRQAGRNLLLSFRESVAKQLRILTGERVAKVYSADGVSELLKKAVEAWINKPEAEELTVLLNAEELLRLEDGLYAALGEQLAKGVTLKASDRFDGGFRIASGDGGVYYDYSLEAVTDLLAGYLSPKLIALLKEAE